MSPTSRGRIDPLVRLDHGIAAGLAMTAPSGVIRVVVARILQSSIPCHPADRRPPVDTRHSIRPMRSATYTLPDLGFARGQISSRKLDCVRMLRSRTARIDRVVVDLAQRKTPAAPGRFGTAGAEPHTRTLLVHVAVRIPPQDLFEVGDGVFRVGPRDR